MESFLGSEDENSAQWLRLCEDPIGGTAGYLGCWQVDPSGRKWVGRES